MLVNAMLKTKITTPLKGMQVKAGILAGLNADGPLWKLLLHVSHSNIELAHL